MDKAIQRQRHPRWHLASNYHRNVRNEPLDFKSSPFLKPIYEDQSPRLVIEKCVQVGVSELLICDTLSLADMGLRIFYVLPTEDLRNKFVRDRVNRPLLNIPYYRLRTRKLGKVEGVLDTDSVGLKSFGKNGLMLFVGSNSKVSFIAFSADVATVDELDKCSQENLSLVPDRLSASKYKFIREVSTPTVENQGIDRRYKESDQKRWLIPCPHCGKKQEINFFINVVREVGDNEYELIDEDWSRQSDRDIQVFCKSCHKPINRLSPGEWVSTYPDRLVSGYHVSQLMSANLSVVEIFDAFLGGLRNETELQRFYNSILGLAYTAKGQKITKAILDECIKAGLNYRMPSRAENATAGVDVGYPLLHVKICDHPKEGHRRLVWVGTVRSFEELHTTFKLFGVKWAVVDALPETRKAKEFQADMKGRCEVWLCQYATSPQIEAVKIKQDEQLIIADRTQTLDDYVADIYTQAVLLPANAATLEDGDFYRHLCASTRVLDPATKIYRWTEGDDPDHFFHAGNYEKIACRFMKKLIDYQPREKRESFPHKRIKRGLRR